MSTAKKMLQGSKEGTLRDVVIAGVRDGMRADLLGGAVAHDEERDVNQQNEP